MKSIFLSHSWKDKFFARNLAEKLQEAGAKVWIDEAELKVGDSLLQKISVALQEADFVGAILSNNSISSGWVQLELKLAMQEEIKGKKIKVLPILIEAGSVPEFLKDKIYADFSNPEKFDSAFSKLLEAMRIEKRPSKKKAKARKIVSANRSILISAEPSLESFTDIIIKEIDKEKMYKPDRQKLLYNVYFELSERPTQEWVQIFDAERSFPRHTMWRRAWVEDMYIIVHCTLEEIKKYHANDIKQDVENTNAKYRKYLHQRALQQQDKKIQEKKEQDDIDDAVEGVDF